MHHSSSLDRSEVGLLHRLCVCACARVCVCVCVCVCAPMDPCYTLFLCVNQVNVELSLCFTEAVSVKSTCVCVSSVFV